MSDVRDEYGNFKSGYSFDEGQRAGVTPSDSRALVDFKIEEEKGRQLRDGLSKFGPETVYPNDQSNPKPKGRKRVIVLQIFSFFFIGNLACLLFAYILGASSWDRGGLNGDLPHDFWWKAVFTLIVIGGAAFWLWRLSVKFFKWLYY